VTVVWASYRLQCAADGVMYQLALCRAARDLDLEVDECPRSQDVASTAERLGMSTDALESFVTSAGRPSGPPWTQEHRRAFAAGIAALASRSRRSFRIPVS
jgi:hypothetical protein